MQIFLQRQTIIFYCKRLQSAQISEIVSKKFPQYSLENFPKITIHAPTSKEKKRDFIELIEWLLKLSPKDKSLQNTINPTQIRTLTLFFERPPLTIVEWQIQEDGFIRFQVLPNNRKTVAKIKNYLKVVIKKHNEGFSFFLSSEKKTIFKELLSSSIDCFSTPHKHRFLKEDLEQFLQSTTDTELQQAKYIFNLFVPYDHTTLKKRYKQLVTRYHPDKFNSYKKSLDYYTGKIQKINSAYEVLRRGLAKERPL